MRRAPAAAPGPAPMSWGEAFALTLAVEVPLYVAALVGLRLAPLRRGLLAAVVVNLATHPLLWWALSRDVTMGAVVLAEVCVVLVEGLIVRVVTRRDGLLALLVALGANAASFAVGLLVTAAGG